MSHTSTVTAPATAVRHVAGHSTPPPGTGVERAARERFGPAERERGDRS